ncbi:MAG: biotin--[acetyl-CoA-carboxylase] ligase [Actinomycetota bacterium]
MTLSEPTISSALRAAGLHAPVRVEERTRSTQDLARALAEAGTPAWTVVVAAHQTHGRGREGRTWVDAPGALLCSIVLRPALAPPDSGRIPLLAGAALAEACEEVAGVAIACRWPNDLLRVDPDVAGDVKVGGILAEARPGEDRVDWVVLGVGVNVGSAPEGVAGAGALEAGEAGAVLAALLRRLPGLLEGDTEAAVRARYVPRCVTLGRRVRARIAAGAIEGLAVGIGDDGSLLVDDGTGIRAVTSGEALHVGDPGAADATP